MISQANIPNALIRTTRRIRLNNGGEALPQRPDSLLENLYREIDKDAPEPDWRHNVNALGMDIAAMLAPDDRTAAFIEKQREHLQAPAKAAQEKLKQKIALGAVLDKSRQDAYEFAMNYEQKDREIAAKHRETYNLPIDPETGIPFSNKEEYKDYLQRKRDDHKEELVEKKLQAKADIDYVKKREDAYASKMGASIKASQLAGRLAKNTEKGSKNTPFSESGGKINKYWQESVGSLVDGSIASVLKDAAELSNTEEVGDVGSRSSKAVFELYQNAKPDTSEPRHIAHYKYKLREKMSTLQASEPHLVSQVMKDNPGITKKEAYEIVDSAVVKVAGELNSRFHQGKPFDDVEISLPKSRNEEVASKASKYEDMSDEQLVALAKQRSAKRAAH